jgi:RNA polymerase sigma-70 factor (ECF subfamily)
MANEPNRSRAGGRVADDDAVLVEQAQAGDMGAFSRLVVRYQDRVLNACWRISGNRDDAQDLAQDAFLQALKKMETFERRASFYTWVFRIAVNLSISHRRRSARRVHLSLHNPEGQPVIDHQAAALVGRVSAESTDPSARMTARETHQAVLEAMDELDEEHRAAVVLKDIEGFDYREIGDILEIPLGTVKSRIHRARMALRDRLGPILAME